MTANPVGSKVGERNLGPIWAKFTARFGLNLREQNLLELIFRSEFEKGIPWSLGDTIQTSTETNSFGANFGELLSPKSRLIKLGLIESITQRHTDPILSTPFVVSRNIGWLLGGVDDDHPSVRVASLRSAKILTQQNPLSDSQKIVSARIAWILKNVQELQVGGLIELIGDVHSSEIISANAVSGLLDLSLWSFPADELEQEDPTQIAFKMGQEALWGQAVWLIRFAQRLDGVQANHYKKIIRMLLESGVSVIVSTRTRLELHPSAVSLEVLLPSKEEQSLTWLSALQTLEGLSKAHAEGIVKTLVGQFNLSNDSILSAATLATSHMNTVEQSGEPIFVQIRRHAWQQCLELSRKKLDPLEAVKRIGKELSPAKLVLSEKIDKSIREIIAHVQNRDLVYKVQGFNLGERGKGVTVMFSGPSGTGKTTAAESIAREMNLDIYKIDLSSLASKYIGETEKNLAKIFDAAEEGGAILLFDEADSIFGKRSAVQDAHDRYANMEVSYLLQRLEEYQGLAFLTTNLESSLDEAFLRRLKFIVRFEKPQKQERMMIWRNAIPAEFHATLDFDKLTDVEFTGGSINNVAVQAAFKAAFSHQPLGMQHIYDAASEEMGKLKRLKPKELEKWMVTT